MSACICMCQMTCRNSSPPHSPKTSTFKFFSGKKMEWSIELKSKFLLIDQYLHYVTNKDTRSITVKLTQLELNQLNLKSIIRTSLKRRKKYFFYHLPIMVCQSQSYNYYVCNANTYINIYLPWRRGLHSGIVTAWHRRD
jgi:hypothetical protein